MATSRRSTTSRMSKVEHPDDWDPQAEVFPMDIDLEWGGIAKPEGWDYPEEYVSGQGERRGRGGARRIRRPLQDRLLRPLAPEEGLSGARAQGRRSRHGDGAPARSARAEQALRRQPRSSTTSRSSWRPTASSGSSARTGPASRPCSTSCAGSCDRMRARSASTAGPSPAQPRRGEPARRLAGVSGAGADPERRRSTRTSCSATRSGSAAAASWTRRR